MNRSKWVLIIGLGCLMILAHPLKGRCAQRSFRDQREQDLVSFEEIRELARVHYARGRNHFRRGEYSEAKVEFEEVLKLEPKHQGAQWYLKTVKAELVKFEKTVRGRLEKAKEKKKRQNLQAALNSIEDSTEARNLRAEKTRRKQLEKEEDRLLEQIEKYRDQARQEKKRKSQTETKLTRLQKDKQHLQAQVEKYKQKIENQKQHMHKLRAGPDEELSLRLQEAEAEKEKLSSQLEKLRRQQQQILQAKVDEYEDVLQSENSFVQEIERLNKKIEDYEQKVREHKAQVKDQGQKKALQAEMEKLRREQQAQLSGELERYATKLQQERAQKESKLDEKIKQLDAKIENLRSMPFPEQAPAEKTLLIEPAQTRLKQDLVQAERIESRLFELQAKINEQLAAQLDECKKELARPFYEEAERYFKGEKYLLARERANKALSIHPNYQAAKKLLGQIEAEEKINIFLAEGKHYYKEREYERAQEEFQKVLEIAYKNKLARNYLHQIEKEIKQEKERLAREKLRLEQKRLRTHQQALAQARLKARQKQARQEKAALRQARQEELARLKAEKEERLVKIRQEKAARHQARQEELARLKAEKEEQIRYQRQLQEKRLEQARIAKERARQEEAALRQARQEELARLKAEKEEAARRRRQAEEKRLEEKRLEQEKVRKERLAKIRQEKAALRQARQEELARQRKERELQARQARQLFEKINIFLAEGKHYYKEREYERAQEEFQKVLEIAYKNKLARNYLHQIEKEIKQEKERLEEEKVRLQQRQRQAKQEALAQARLKARQDEARKEREQRIRRQRQLREERREQARLEKEKARQARLKAEQERLEKSRQKKAARLEIERQEIARRRLEERQKRLEEARLRKEKPRQAREEELARQKEQKEKEQQERDRKIELHYGRGKTHFHNKDYIAARKEFKDILILDPKNKYALNALVKVNATEAREEKERERRKKKAEEAQRKKQQQLFNQHLAQGKIYFHQEKYPEALEEFGQILFFDPDNSLAQRYMIRCKKRLSWANRREVTELEKEKLRKQEEKRLAELRREEEEKQRLKRQAEEKRREQRRLAYERKVKEKALKRAQAKLERRARLKARQKQLAIQQAEKEERLRLQRQLQEKRREQARLEKGKARLAMLKSEQEMWAEAEGEELAAQPAKEKLPHRPAAEDEEKLKQQPQPVLESDECLRLKREADAKQRRAERLKEEKERQAEKERLARIKAEREEYLRLKREDEVRRRRAEHLKQEKERQAEKERLARLRAEKEECARIMREVKAKRREQERLKKEQEARDRADFLRFKRERERQRREQQRMKGKRKPQAAEESLTAQKVKPEKSVQPKLRVQDEQRAHALLEKEKARQKREVKLEQLRQKRAARRKQREQKLAKLREEKLAELRRRRQAKQQLPAPVLKKEEKPCQSCQEKAARRRAAEQERIEKAEKAEKEKAEKVETTVKKPATRPQQKVKENRIKQHFAEGKILYYRHQYEQAMKEFNQVLRLDPEYSLAGEFLRKCQAGIEGEKQKELEKIKQRARHLQEAASQVKEEKEKEVLAKIKELFRRGKSYFRRGLYKDAIASFEKVIELEGNPRIYYTPQAKEFIKRAQQQIEEERKKRALEIAEEEIKRKQAQALQGLKAQERAQEQARQKQEELIRKHYRLGKVYYGQGNYPMAIAEFNKIKQINPEHSYVAYAQKYILSCRQKIRQHEEAQLRRELKKQAPDLPDEQAGALPEELLMQARWYYRQADYEQTIKICRTVLEMEPFNKQALDLLHQAENRQIKREKLKADQEVGIDEKEMMNEVAQEQVLPDEKTRAVREKEITPLVKMPAIREKLKNLITVDFRDVDLAFVLNFLADSTGVNIIPASGVSLEGKKVTMRMKDIPAENALKYILKNQGLTYRLEEDAVWVASPSELDKEEIETRVYFLNRGSGMFTEFERTVATGTGLGGAAAISKITTIKDVLEEAVDWPKSSKLVLDERTGALIISNTPTNLQIIEDILYNLDITPMQVLIEARFVELEVTNVEQLGIEWKITEDYGDRRTKDKSNLTQFESDAGWDFSSFTRATEGLNLTYTGVLTYPQFQAVLHALSETQDAKTLSAPKVSTLNNQLATIKVVDEWIYPTRYEFQVVQSDINGDGDFDDANETTYKNVPVDFITKDIGILLHVTPNIGADGKTITLALVPEVSEGTADFFSYTGNVSLPKFTSRTLSTSVVINNGDTVALGGLVKESTTKTVTKVPLLGDIPILGHLFRKKSESIVRKNLLIFVTATIISPSGEKITTVSH